MKLIRKWKDTKYNVENFLYENKDGLKVLHTLNKQTLDTFASLVLNAGSYFEKDLEVPSGTAHFLEHLLLNPNKKLKTMSAIDAFEFGNKNRSRMFTNASTGFRSMTFYGHCHHSRENDLMERLEQIICYPMDLIPKHISKERKVILAEKQRDLKIEKDSMLQLVHFILDGKIHTQDYKIIGKTDKDIKSIETEHLIKFYKSQFTINNSIFSIQSPNELDSEIISHIGNISKVLKQNGKDNAKIYDENLENKKQIGFYFNTEEQGLTVHLLKFQDQKERKKNYRDDNLFDMRHAVINHVAFNELREKKGYIYAISNFYTSFFTWQYGITGLSITFEPKYFKKALEGLNEIINHGSIKFLKTSQGKKWFDNYISKFIFPRTVNYNSEYSQEKSSQLLEKYELFDFEKAKKAAEKITIDELIEYIEKENKRFDYSYWIDTPINVEKVKKEIAKMKMFKDHSITHNIVSY